MSRRVAGPSEHLAVTGGGIDDIRLAKKPWVLPSPVNYTFKIQAMSAEKLPFVLLGVFTIGFCVDGKDSLLHDKERVQGVIEGVIRVLAACMSMEEILKPTNEFTNEVFQKFQLQLNQFGLLLYDAKVKLLVDVRGHEYFSSLGGQKTQMEAANDQAEASPSLNSAIGVSGYADSASSGIYSASPPTPCEGRGNTEPCSKCMYSKYQPEQVFQKILSLSDVQRKGSYRLYLPNRPHAARFCPPANGSEVSVYDVQMKLWPMHFRTSGGRAFLTRGWTRFAQAKQLGEGDKITLYELKCKRGTGARVFMIGVSRKDCFQILGVPIN